MENKLEQVRIDRAGPRESRVGRTSYEDLNTADPRSYHQLWPLPAYITRTCRSSVCHCKQGVVRNKLLFAIPHLPLTHAYEFLLYAYALCQEKIAKPRVLFQLTICPFNNHAAPVAVKYCRRGIRMAKLRRWSRFPRISPQSRTRDSASPPHFPRFSRFSPHPRTWSVSRSRPGATPRKDHDSIQCGHGETQSSML